MSDLRHRTASSGLVSRVRARLQPCQTSPESRRALAPEVHSRKITGGTPRASGTWAEVAQKPAHRILATALTCILAVIMLGANPVSDPSARYTRIGHNMMCVCSCGQVLLECNHVGCPDSARMTAELRDQTNGPTSGGSAGAAADKAVYQWFESKYGATVLAAPIRGGFDNLAWILPFSLFVLAIFGTAFVVRLWAQRRRLAPAAASSAPMPTDACPRPYPPRNGVAMSLLAGLVLALASFAYIFWPERNPFVQADKTRVDSLRERRDVVYENLRDLNFEYLAGKYPEQDYNDQRRTLEDEAAAVLAEMDALEARGIHRTR